MRKKSNTIIKISTVYTARTYSIKMSSDVNLASTKDESPKPGLGEREGDVDSNNRYTGDQKDIITDTNTETTPQCTEHDCIDDEDQYKFECKKCHRLVHYKCTKLAPYQIALFMTKGYQRYICVKCVNIPDCLNNYRLVGITDKTDTVHKSLVEKLRIVIEDKDKIISSMRDTQKNLRATDK